MTQPLHLLQLTDLHLRASPAGEIYQVRTHDSFHAVLRRAFRDAGPPPAAVLVTGDIAEDPLPEVYARFRTAMEPVGLPVLCLPGNHDDVTAMRPVLDDGLFSVCRNISLGAWRIVMLDSAIPGEDGGTLAPAELTRLDRELAAEHDRWIAVAVHHQPLPMGSAWLDAVGMDNGEALLARLAADDRARLVLWGHVHQASDRVAGALRLLSTPSTCAQFAPGTVGCTMDTRPPGFRRLTLHPDGAIDTEVHWLEELSPTSRPTDSRAAQYGRPAAGAG
jgi:Icc protein